MKKFLIPNYFKKIGFPMLFAGLLLFFYVKITKWTPDWLTVRVFTLWGENPGENNILDEIIGMLILVGGMLVIFSRMKVEDSYIQEHRNEAFAFSFLVNFSIIGLFMVSSYEFDFLEIMIYNLCTPILIYIARFYWAFYQNNRKSKRNAE